MYEIVEVSRCNVACQNDAAIMAAPIMGLKPRHHRLSSIHLYIRPDRTCVTANDFSSSAETK